MSAGTVSQLSLTGFPLFTVAGVTQPFTVTAQDAFGNPVTNGFTDTVQVGSLSYTFKASDHGKHVFTTTLTSPGSASLTVMDTSKPSVQSGTETNITVVSAAVGLAITIPRTTASRC